MPKLRSVAQNEWKKHPYIFFKIDYFILPLFLVPKLRSGEQNEWKKHLNIFSTFGSKINELERKKSEKNEKIPKT